MITFSFRELMYFNIRLLTGGLVVQAHQEPRNDAITHFLRELMYIYFRLLPGR